MTHNARLSGAAGTPERECGQRKNIHMHTHIPAVWRQRNIHISTDFRRPLCRVGNSFYGLPMNSSTALQRRHRSRARPIVPPLLHSHELPGPMSLNRLSRGGTVCSLDGHSGYWSEHGDTLYGRALIVHNIIPSATVACMRTALWVWMGGLFPETVDVLSGSHYRTMRHGRPIRVFARRVDHDHVQTLGDLNAGRLRRHSWSESMRHDGAARQSLFEHCPHVLRGTSPCRSAGKTGDDAVARTLRKPR